MLDGTQERLSQSALARHLGVKRQAIHQLIERGILVAGDDGLIDLATATAAIARSLRPDSKSVASVLGNPTPPPSGAGFPDGTDYQRARALRETAEAAMAQLKLAQMAGELVEAARVRRVVIDLAATIRSGFERLPDKLADRLAAESTAAACHALLTSEIDLVLHDLAKGAEHLELEADNGRV